MYVYIYNKKVSSDHLVIPREKERAHIINRTCVKQTCDSPLEVLEAMLKHLSSKQASCIFEGKAIVGSYNLLTDLFV